MRILQVGLGSMGKRRIRNLLWNKISKDHIFGFDINPAKLREAEREFQIITFKKFDDAVREINPNLIIISTPPEHHSKYFLYAAKNKLDFFCEVSTSSEDYGKLLRYLDKKFVAAPSCTFRFFPAIKKIKKLVNSGEIGKILAFNYHVGQYLPDWHPWEDYSKVYFAKKETGASREMLVYELIWLTDVLGSHVKNIAGIKNKVSKLRITADDVFAISLEFENAIIGTILIDLLSRTPKRTLRIIGETGIIDWEWKDFTIKIFNCKKGRWKHIRMKEGYKERGYINTEDMYREEMKTFLDAVKGKEKWPFSFKENFKILKNLYEFEKDSI